MAFSGKTCSLRSSPASPASGPPPAAAPLDRAEGCPNIDPVLVDPLNCKELEQNIDYYLVEADVCMSVAIATTATEVYRVQDVSIVFQFCASL